MNSETLVLGATGYIGQNVLAAFRRAGLPVTGWSSKDCDLAVDPLSELSDFGAVVNCAGEPDEDRAVTDREYRRKMCLVNTVAPGRIRRARKGYFVHVPTPFELDLTIDSPYIESKRLGNVLANANLNVWSGWLYGGTGSRQFDSVARDGVDKELLIDNVRVANPTPMEYFADTVVHLVNHKITGNVLVFDREPVTAEQLAKDILGIWGPHWRVGRYQDASIRPLDWSHNRRTFPSLRCRRTEEGFCFESPVR